MAEIRDEELLWEWDEDDENPVGNTYIISYGGEPALYVDAWAFLQEPKSDEANRWAAHESARGMCRRLIALLKENVEAVFPHDDDTCCEDDEGDA